MAKMKDMNEQQLTKLINKVEKILEDRRDDLEYGEIRKTKGSGKNKVETEEIDFLITELKGQESAHFTRLAKKYFEANDAYKRAEVEKDALNEELKEMTAPLWDAKDKIHQRLVTTVSYGFMLTAENKPDDKKKVNWEQVANDLATALNVETKLLEEIIEKNTEITKGKVTPERLREPSQKHKKAMKQRGVGKQQVEENFNLDKMKGSINKWFKKFSNIVDRYMNQVDTMLESVNKELTNA